MSMHVVSIIVHVPAAYRFFPLLLVFTVILIAVSNRDFGPILWAERAAMPPPPPISHRPRLINTKAPSDRRSPKPEGLCPPNSGMESGVGSDSETEKVELRGSAGSIGEPADKEQEITGE